jgi:hypothetical protein
MRFKVFPYKQGSVSAKALATGLEVKRISNTYEPRRNDVVINWGNSRTVHYVRTSLDLNKHEAIALACNKLKTFYTLERAGFTHLPEFTEFDHIAEDWLEKGKTIYARTSLTGHSGHGIVIVGPSDVLPRAPLYTVKTKHKHEFRVHVFKGKVIDVQQKKRRLDYTGPNTGIRNHSNGYIYARVNVEVPDVLLSSCIQAVNILGLDFGAVDVGYRERDNRVFVFEINTAPGLVGTTLDKYVNTFKEYLNGL